MWKLNWYQKQASEVQKAIADDFRKVGVYTLGISVAGVILPNDDIALPEALILCAFGIYIWLSGIVLTAIRRKQDGNHGGKE